MAQIAIPTSWLQAVSKILQKGTVGREIVWTLDALSAFEADFLGAWPFQAHDDFRRHLSGVAVTGCPITMKTPAGTTYEFMFNLKSKNTYGKILLTSDQKKIYIFSAHLPLKTKLSCE